MIIITARASFLLKLATNESVGKYQLYKTQINNKRKEYILGMKEFGSLTFSFLDY